MVTRVAITGIGLVTPLGLSTAANVERSARGESGIGAIHDFDVEGYPCKAGAQVPAFEIIETLRFPKNHKFMHHAVRCALAAAREAIDQSAVKLEERDTTRIALYTGSGQSGIEYQAYFPALSAAWEGDRETDFKYVGGMPSRLIDRYIVLNTLSNGGLGLLAMEFGIKGPNGNVVQSDTASAQAVSCAYFDLVENRCDAALAGGYDCVLTVANFLAYHQAGLLSPSEPDQAYRPFDRRRDGLVLGAGAGFLFMERWDHAEERGAEILGELCSVNFGTETGAAGGLWSTDTLRAVTRKAVDEGPIEFVVGRGIGTQQEDGCEAQAIAGVIGTDVPVTALKSQTGYLGAATAAVELGLGLMCGRQGCVPPIARYTTPDPELALDLVSGRPRPLPGPAPKGLFLSRSWGGQMAGIVARAAKA